MGLSTLAQPHFLTWPHPAALLSLVSAEAHRVASSAGCREGRSAGSVWHFCVLQMFGEKVPSKSAQHRSQGPLFRAVTNICVHKNGKTFSWACADWFCFECSFLQCKRTKARLHLALYSTTAPCRLTALSRWPGWVMLFVQLFIHLSWKLLGNKNASI